MDEALNSLTDGVLSNPLVAGAAGVGAGLLVGAGVGAVVGAAVAKRKARKRKTKKSRSSRRKSSNRKRRTPYTAGKRQDRSHKRIRYTKKGQPYVIKANGRALFISKASAKRSKKLKGGRY